MTIQQSITEALKTMPDAKHIWVNPSVSYIYLYHFKQLTVHYNSLMQPNEFLLSVTNLEYEFKKLYDPYTRYAE